MSNTSLSGSSLLNSKLFKFKKNTNPRRFGDNLGSTNPFNNLINIENEQSTVTVEGQTVRKISS
jgi:hypothetical protein